MTLRDSAPPARPPAPSPPGAAPLHLPKRCRRCGAPVFWAAVLDGRGERLRRADGLNWRAIAVDAEPHPDGRVLLAHREGQGIVARVLHHRPPPQALYMRRAHIETCRPSKSA